MLPYPTNSFPAYQLIQEYFLLKEKFLFIDVTGLLGWNERGSSKRFSVTFTLADLPIALAKVVNDRFMLNSTPALNLFESDAEPISLDNRRNELRIKPVREGGGKVQVYSVDSVTGRSKGAAKKTEYIPLNKSFGANRDEPVYQVTYRVQNGIVEPYTPFNEYHNTRQAQFYLFDCEDDQESANALFERAIEWASSKKLDRIIGPKGFGPLDGYGLLVDGYEHRQVMTMMNYNYPYYQRLIENLGFSKEVDFVSCYIDPRSFRIPERVHQIAERVQQRGTLSVLRFKNKNELKSWVNRIGRAYNQAFIKNWEYYPLSEREITFVVSNILVIADPRIIKVITHEEDVVGFLFAFPDISAALQRASGHLLPFGLPDLLIEMRRTKWVALNGMGILEEFQGHGGNALMYSEMEKTFRELDVTLEHVALHDVVEVL